MKKWIIALVSVAVVAGASIGAVMASTSSQGAPEPTAQGTGDGPAFLGIRIVQTDEGVVIVGVEDGGPADVAGALRGDLIKQFNGVDIARLKDVHEQLALLSPGDAVTMVVERDGVGSVTLTITVGERPQPTQGLPLDRLLGLAGLLPRLVEGDVTILDENDQPVVFHVTPGKLATVDVDGGSVTVTRRDGQVATFAIPEGATIAAPGHGELTLQDLKERLDALDAGQSITVVVVQKDGQVVGIFLVPGGLGDVLHGFHLGPHARGSIGALRQGPPRLDAIIGGGQARELRSLLEGGDFPEIAGLFDGLRRFSPDLSQRLDQRIQELGERFRQHLEEQPD